MTQPEKKDRCDSCHETFGSVGKDNFVVTRYDQSSVCTACVEFDSARAKRSRREDWHYQRYHTR